MARYIKANYLVVQYLHLENDRNRLGDGNYLLWQADMLAFGPLTDLSASCAQIGGIALLAHEARQEQDGTVVRELPIATDERFVIPAADSETGSGSGSGSDSGNGSETGSGSGSGNGNLDAGAGSGSGSRSEERGVGK